MATALFLIGLPGSGKSTFRELFCRSYLVASSDDFIEKMAADLGKTYNDVFQAFIDPATKHFNHMIYYAVEQKRDLVIDRTNLTVQSRKKILDRLPVVWEKIAVYFDVQDPELWRERLERPGKTIPQNVLSLMRKSMEYPTLSEGFSRILEYRTC